MKHVIVSIATLLTFSPRRPQAPKPRRSPNGSRPSAKGAAQYFTGSVIVDPSRELAPHGTAIRAANTSSSRPARDGCKKKAVRSGRSSRAT
jgi:hypothetical protein